MNNETNLSSAEYYPLSLYLFHVSVNFDISTSNFIDTFIHDRKDAPFEFTQNTFKLLLYFDIFLFIIFLL